MRKLLTGILVATYLSITDSFIFLKMEEYTKKVREKIDDFRTV